jgi:hypothetical protein
MDELVDTGTPSRLMQDISERAGITGEEMNMEIENRKAVLQWLIDNKKRSLMDVKMAIMKFNREPENALQQIS